MKSLGHQRTVVLLGSDYGRMTLLPLIHQHPNQRWNDVVKVGSLPIKVFGWFTEAIFQVSAFGALAGRDFVNETLYQSRLSSLNRSNSTCVANWNKWKSYPALSADTRHHRFTAGMETTLHSFSSICPKRDRTFSKKRKTLNPEVYYHLPHEHSYFGYTPFSDTPKCQRNSSSRLHEYEMMEAASWFLPNLWEWQFLKLTLDQ